MAHAELDHQAEPLKWTALFQVLRTASGEVAVNDALEELRRFAAAGGDVLTSQNRSGDTLLHAACLNKHGGPMAVALLEEYGADPNAPAEGGWTPAHRCANNGSAEAMAALLVHGVDLTLKADDGKTAKDWAEDKGHQEVLDIIEAPLVKSARKR